MGDKAQEHPEGASKDSEIIPGYSSMEQFTKDGFKVLMEAIKHSNALPSGRDWDFYNISDSFKEIMKVEGNHVLRLMNQVMRCNDLDSNLRNRVLDEKIELVIEANDIILEKVANNIDEMNGIRKTVVAPVVLQTVSAQLPVNGSWNRQTAATVTVSSVVPESSGQNCIKLITAKNIIRPQKFFKDQIDNRNKTPWSPRITEKPNSLKPLAIFLEEYEDRQEYSHPYEFELDRFQPTPSQLIDEKSVPPKSLSDTPLIEIDKAEQLDELVETLRHCKEFSVDVEHHSYRSFMGITCLIQISTEDKDYLIDALALRDKLSILNEVFTKNTIVKIFHGADKDIEWLQRDLSLYVVNMFDTHQAAKALQYPALSLAFLMKKFCNVTPNKQFQLADWRIRPLPDELKSYAREDTHYLIYIYKMMKRELLHKTNKCDKLLRSVIERSTEVCKKRYFKPILHEDSHLELYRKCKKMFDNRQMYALKEIYVWRDNIARIEDESLGYVLPNHMLLQISELLPREMQGILACCNPIPPLVRSHLLELHQIILKAREQPLEKAILKETSGRGVLKEMSKVNMDSVLHCPHDLTKTNEFRDDLPTLLQNEQYKAENKRVAQVDLAIEKPSSYSIFNSDQGFKPGEAFKKLHTSAYLSPYERYKLVKPFVVAEDEAAKAQKEKDEKTDDERITSIRDHFVQLSKKFSEELQAQKEEEERKERELSLIEMGASRKRKRDEIDSESPDVVIVEDSFYTPVPVISDVIDENNFYRRKKPRKRKFDEINDGGNEGGKKKKNKKKGKKGNVQAPGQFKNEGNKLNLTQVRSFKTEGKQQNQIPIHQNKGNGNKQNQAQNVPKSKRKRNNAGQGPQNVQKGGNQPKKKFKCKNAEQNNKSSNFMPYDYSSVDFRQFQGGAGSASGGVQMKRTFQPKNRGKHNKKGAKSSTFANLGRHNRGQHN
ncbi:exosome complex component 10 homolog [Tribolium castaneum]|uniref:Exosome complex component 10 homolog n=1 Tax=Tribolium castaneum TaxID=7070 RepID=D6WNA2_TRICA|nr:PREDICTED: exosome component 10 [Tribolium castaneum]EFA03774.2 Exosome component 10-like Protein [Tribolium castaneum]|eukprot:XP_015835408.1 PREDICTED: exosome component 10 [Tribolium castaneum]